MAKRQNRMLRRIRRNTVAVLFDSINEQLELSKVPKARKAFYQDNRKAMRFAIEFMNNPRINPVTGLEINYKRKIKQVKDAKNRG